MSEYVLEIKNIRKEFPGVVALDGVSLLLKRGEIHALVGENGAGKSTLMKILAGIYSLDQGEILFDGKPFRAKRPVDALEKGIAMVHQELDLIPEMTVEENVFAGREKTKGAVVDKRGMLSRTKELMDSLGIDINPRTKIKELSTAQQQMVAITRAIAFDAEVIIMDEPTSAITDREAEKLFEIIRKLKEHGALTNGSCGIHVHINAEPFDARTLRNITNIMAAKEDLIYKALGVSVDRQHRWCQPVDTRFLEELNRRKPKSMEAVERIWYNGESRRDQHYDDSRYHCLNLHSVFQKGTVEFRLFNGTLHAGKIKAYIQFCLAIGAQALNQSCASRRKTQTSNEKYTFRTWLLRLGLNGEEFATARQHLLANLPGCIAWKDPAQAEAQKERMRQKREKELAERIQRQETIHPIEELESAGEAQESPAFCMRM